MENPDVFVWFLRCETKHFGLVTSVLAIDKPEAIAIARKRYPKFAIQFISKQEYESVRDGTQTDRRKTGLDNLRRNPRRTAIL